MSQPRRQRPPDPEVVELKAQVVQLQDDLARLRSANTAQALERLGSRITALEQKREETQAPEVAPPPAVDLVPLLEDIAAVREQVARMSAGAVPSRADLERLGSRITALEQQPATEPQPPPEPPKVDLAPYEQRIAAVEDRAARLEAGTGSSPAISLLAERVTALETSGRRTEPQEPRLTTTQVEALIAARQQQVLTAIMAEVAPLFGMVDGVARDVLTLKQQSDERDTALLQATIDRLSEDARQLDGTFKADRTLYSALFPSGMQVANAALGSDIDASKLASGDIAAARMTTNLISSFNATAGGASAAKITTGDLPTAQMQTNAAAAVNAGSTSVNGSKVTGALDTSVTIGGNKITGNFTLGAGQSIGFFNAAAAAQQAVSAFTNNLASGGTNNQTASYSIVDYATDATAIQQNAYQTARTLNLVVAALRTYGILG